MNNAEQPTPDRSVINPTQWRVCVLLSQRLCPGGDWWRVAESVVQVAAEQPGAWCLQLREKSIADQDYLDRAQRLVALCRPWGISVAVNDRPDIAVLSAANAVHLGQDDLPCEAVRQWTGQRLVIGVSTSNLTQAKDALKQGADYCGVGPMFPSLTKHKQTIAGPAYLRQYCQWDRLPHLAIGGITSDNISLLVKAGAQAVGVSRAVCSAADPAQVARRLAEALMG